MISLARRIVYLGYYFWRADRQLLARFIDHVRAEMGWSRGQQWRRIITDSLRFNISILEYYQFRFFELTDEEKTTWAGTGTMYEFQRAANPLAARGILSDKRLFYRAYEKYFRHKLYVFSEMHSDPESVQKLLEQHETLVFKKATGNCGLGVSFECVAGWSADRMLSYMGEHGFDLVETFIQQHPKLKALSPSAVNTVRVFTQITNAGEYQVLGCRLRISVASPIDNLAAGNLAAPIDLNSGVVNGSGVYSDITRRPEDKHPITGWPIVGFQVPFWAEILAMVREASFLHPENRSIGWDIVITDQGPSLLEGNHDWCKLVWQMPVNRGLKHLLDVSK